MHILADVFGGDKPQEIVYGVSRALGEDSTLKVTVTGDEGKIKELIASLKDKKAMNTALAALNEGRLIICHAPEVVTNDDSPTGALKEKKDSSMVRAMDLLNGSDEYAGMLSSGNTGALLAGGFLKTGRIKGVLRPTLCGVMPTCIDGQGVAIADAGANVDCKPEFLTQFAHMASIYMNTAYGVAEPRVALLSVGTEEKKGDELTSAAHALLKADTSINFCGNMEARDALSGEFDVIVSDGFGGNVLLKAVEGTGKFVSTELKAALKSSILAKLGMLLLARPLKRFKRKMDYHQYGGAPILGLKKIICKAHGSCNSLAVLVVIRQIKKMYAGNLVAKIEEMVKREKENTTKSD